MKSSLILAATGALLVAAGPVRNVKKAVDIEWVVDIVTVTVTATDVEVQPASTDCLEGTNAPRPQPQPSTKPLIPSSAPAPAPTPSTASAISVPAMSASPSTTPLAMKVSSTTSSSSPVATATAVEKMSAPAPAVAAPPGQNADYQTVMLYYHNIHRANHSVDNLAWDAGLAQEALTTAKTCVFQHDMHEGGGGYGQNLALWGSTGNIDDMGNKAGAFGANNQWYNGEVENWPSYDQNNGPTDRSLDSWAHFTQVVWKGSTHVGCATFKCPAGTALSFQSWYTVCNYSPPGNFQGEYRANVLAPQGMKTVSVDL